MPTVAVIDSNVWPLQLVRDDPQTSDVSPLAYVVDFSPVDRRVSVAMPKHSEAEERQRYVLGEEYSADLRIQSLEGEPNATNHKILEEGGMLSEWRA